MALAAGVDIKVVSAMLRHSSIAITADLYAEVVTELAREAAEKTAAMIPGRRRAIRAGPPTGPQGSDPSNGKRAHEMFSLFRQGAAGRIRTCGTRFRNPQAIRLLVGP
jgi:hypothetical protein